MAATAGVQGYKDQVTLSKGTVKLSGFDKAAVLLVTLGEDLGRDVLKHLTPEEIRQMGVHLSDFPEITQEKTSHTLSELSNLLKERSTGRKEYLRSLLSEALSHESAAGQAEAPGVMLPTGLEALNWMEPDSVFKLIRHENQQVTSLILSLLGSEQSSKMLSRLPDERRNEVVYRMATLERPQPWVIDEVGRVLRDEFAHMEAGTSSDESIGGVKATAKILSQMDRRAEEKALAAISLADADLGKDIRGKMFLFDDTLKISDRGIQEVLKEVNKDVVGIALRTATSEMKDKFFKNMSERAVEIMQEDMETRPPVKRSEVDRAQQEIAGIVSKLLDSGKIVLEQGAALEEGDDPDALV